VKGTGVNALWVHKGHRCNYMGVFESKATPVCWQPGSEVGLLNAQVLEKLKDTFLDRKINFWRHVDTSSYCTYVFAQMVLMR
jgi:hypothetical protein